MFPFEQRRRSIVRHPMNNRQQRSGRATYVQSVKNRGVCEGVRGEAWLLQPLPQNDVGQQQSPYLALSYGSLSEAYYQALIDEPTNSNLIIRLKRGLEARLLHHRTLPDVVHFLIHYHNNFHAGSGTSFCELVQMVPDVTQMQSIPSPPPSSHRHKTHHITHSDTNWYKDTLVTTHSTIAIYTHDLTYDTSDYQIISQASDSIRHLKILIMFRSIFV